MGRGRRRRVHAQRDVAVAACGGRSWRCLQGAQRRHRHRRHRYMRASTFRQPAAWQRPTCKRASRRCIVHTPPIRAGCVARSARRREASTTVTLQVVRPTGEVGLDRSYTFGPTDCASASQLARAHRRSVAELVSEWANPPAPPRVATQWTEVLALAAVQSMWLPLGVDAQAGALVDYGSRADRFGGLVLVRAGVPQAAGSGRFQLTTFLAGAGWRLDRGEVDRAARSPRRCAAGQRHRSYRERVRLAAVVGGRRVCRPPGVVGTDRRRGRATGLRHARLRGMAWYQEDIPLLRIGVGGMFGIRTKR